MARGMRSRSHRIGALEIRLGAGDWYRATQILLDEDPIKAAREVAKAETYWPDVI